MFSYFAAPLMNKLTGLFSASPGRRFLRFVLNLNLRPNPIQQGELDLQMENGSVELKDVELNEKTLNKKLGDNSLFTVKSGVVGSIAISVPWNDIRKESIKVTLSNIELIIVPGKNETFFEETVAPIAIQSEDDEEDDMPDHGPDPTLNAMEKMFEDIFSNIEVTIHNLSIFIETSGGKSSLFSSNLSNVSVSQAVASSLNGNYTIETHLAYAKFAKDSEGAKTIHFRDISVKLDEKPTDSTIKPTTPTTSTPMEVSFDDVGITRRTLSNNVILSYLSSDPSLYDVVTYKTGSQSTTPTSSPSKSDSGIFSGGESSQKIEVAAKLTNSTLKCNLSLENYHRLMFIIGQFLDPANSSTTPPANAQTTTSTSNMNNTSTMNANSASFLSNSMNPLSLSSSSTISPPHLSPSKINTSNNNLNSSGFYNNYNNNNNMSSMGERMNNLGMSNLGMSSLGMSSLGMSSLGISNFGASNLGSSMLQFSAFFPPGASGRTDSTFFSNGNLMDSAIFGTVEESRLEKSILTKYSAFSSWTPSLATQKILLRVEIRSGNCSFVIPSENGKTITTKVDFEGLVLKTKKLRVMQSLELRFNKLTVSADDETSIKPVVECGINSIRSSITDYCFKANISLMQSEETNDTTITIEVQSKPIYILLDNLWLESVKQLIPADNGTRSPGGKKGKFSLHVKLHATSAHVVIPFPKKEGLHYFPSRFGKRNWLMDLYLENLKLTHGAIGNMGNGKTHIVADSILSYFGMKYDNDAVKWLDIQKPSKLVLRTKNPAPNPAHTHAHAHAHGHASASSHASSAHAHARFLSPALVYGGKKIDLKNFDVVSMQKTSAILVEILLAPTTIEITKDDYDILMELLKLFSSDEESPMTNIDISCADLRLTLHDRKKQRLKKKKTEISAKTPTEVYYNTYRLHAENLDFLGSLSHFTTKSNLFVLKVAELEGSVSDNNCTNQGEKIIPLIQKVTRRKPKHESVLSLLVPSGRVIGDEFHISISDKLCIAPNISLLFGFVDWFTAPPPPPLSLSASSLNSSSCSTSSSSSNSNINTSNLSNTTNNLNSSKSVKSIPLIPPSSPASMTSSQRSSTQSTTTSTMSSSSNIAVTSHTQIIFPNVLLVHTSVNAGASQMVVSVDRLTVTIVSSVTTKINVLLDGPRVLLSLLRNYPNLESPHMLKYLMENNFKEVLTLLPNRTEAASSMEIAIKLNDHATKSVISVDFENRKFELSTLAESFHALKTTFPLFVSDIMEYFVGDENEKLGNVPIVTHADESSSTVTLPQMAARQGEGLSDSLLSRSWWGGGPAESSSPQTSVKNAREILSQGYFVVEHPENEEDRKKFQSNLDVLRKTELVLEIEQEVEVDEAQEREANYEMDDSILDSWIVMGSENPREESILNPETVIMICGLIFSWKIDIQQKDKHSKQNSSPNFNNLNNNNNFNNNSNSSHIVQLFVDIPLIRFETFPDAWAHRKSMSMRIEFNDIRIEDHLLSSVFKNVFSFDIPPSKKDNGNRVPQNVSVASIAVSARKGFGDSIHYNTKVSLAPVYLGINQRTLDLLLDFFNRSSPDAENVDVPDESDIPSPPVYFDRFQVSALKLVVDYKPRGLGSGDSSAGMDYSRIVAGGCLWLVALIPLDRASFTLSNVDLTNTTLDKLPEGVAATWMPNVLATNIPQYLKGVQPIKIVAKMGSGVIGLVRVPIQEYRRDNNILLGVGKGIQTLTFEVLNFGSRVTVSANKILKRTERIISGSPARQPNEQKISSYANQPSDIREGAVQGMQVLLAALSGAADGIISRPLDEYQRNGKWGFVSTLLRGLPGCVLQPVIGVTGAVSKLTLGLRNTLDSKEKLKADAKYKSNNDFNNSNNNNNFTFEFHETSDSAILQEDEEYFQNRSRIQAFQVMEDYGGESTNNNNNNNNNNVRVYQNNNNNNNNNRYHNNNNSPSNSTYNGRNRNTLDRDDTGRF